MRTVSENLYNVARLDEGKYLSKIRISLSNSYFLGQTLILGVCNREHRKAIGTRVHNTDLTDTAFSFRWVIGEAYNAWDQMKVKYICKQILGI